MTEDKIKELKLSLTYVYTVHRIEPLMEVLSMVKNYIRSILLVISTVWHPYKLLGNLNTVSAEESDQIKIKVF